MTTLAYPMLERLATAWENAYDSAVCSGIVGDAAHRARGGYHMSREDNPAGNYSITRPDDQYGPGDAAAGIDMSMNARDMALCTRRLLVAYNSPADPRRKYLNAFNGWLGGANATRYDIVARRAGYASPDHKWHCHGEVRRRYVNTPIMVIAVGSLLRGESVAAYLRAIGVAPLAPAAASLGRAAPPRPAVPPYPGRLLRRDDGQTRPDLALRVWQQRMLARGWASVRVADGYFGAHTEQAVRRFQAQCRITADGIIGPRTWPLPWTQPIGS